MTKGLVSIAIPAYKSIYLQEAIASAISQDYSQIELIIVNDHSPEPIKQIVDTFDDCRIRYYCNESNLGKKSIVLNWNKCIEYATGEYFILLCDDDILMPNFVSTLIELSHKHPDCKVFHGRKHNIYQSGRQEETPLWPEYESAKDFTSSALTKQRHHTVSEFMVYTALAKASPYIVFPVGFYSDKATILEWAKVNGICSSQIPIMKFRYSSTHISSSMTPQYAKGKVLASIAYWNWIHDNYDCSPYETFIQEDTASTIGEVFYNTSWQLRLWILHITPNSILSARTKLLMIVAAITSNYES